MRATVHVAFVVVRLVEPFCAAIEVDSGEVFTSSPMKTAWLVSLAREVAASTRSLTPAAGVCVGALPLATPDAARCRISSDAASPEEIAGNGTVVLVVVLVVWALAMTGVVGLALS